MDTFNDMQLVKRRLFAMRNGIIADVLRRGYIHLQYCENLCNFEQENQP